MDDHAGFVQRPCDALRPAVSASRCTPRSSFRSTLGNIILEGQALSGPLPEAWAAPGALSALYDMKLAGNDLTGSLPGAWGSSQAFPSLFRM